MSDDPVTQHHFHHESTITFHSFSTQERDLDSKLSIRPNFIASMGIYLSMDMDSNPSMGPDPDSVMGPNPDSGLSPDPDSSMSLNPD